MPDALTHSDPGLLAGAAAAWIIGLAVLIAYVVAFKNYIRRGD